MSEGNYVLAVQAIGDALGVPYEGRPPTTDPVLTMSGGGLGDYQPGEYSDDTQMSVALARAASRTDLRLEAGLAAGNGALMRTSVLGTLPFTRDEIAQVASDVAAITHADPLCAQSCVLWSEAVRLARTDGVLDIASGLDLLDPADRDPWARRISESEAPRAPDHGGFTVTCLQRAWWAVSSTSNTPAALELVVRQGGDTDTVAAVAGGLCGALRGLDGIPGRWLSVHGWPGLDLQQLVDLGAQVSRGPEAERVPSHTARPGTWWRRWLPSRDDG